MTFKNHLHGNDEHRGLICQLSQRAGILSKLSKHISKEKLSILAHGIFYSKLVYCLPLFGNVFYLDEYKEEGSIYLNYTIQDNYKLQVIQNKVNQILSGSPYMTSTKELLEKTNSLSIQQIIAFQILVLTFKIVHSSQPNYIASKMRVKGEIHNLRSNTFKLKQVDYTLSQSCEGFIYKAISLFNKLDDNIRRISNLNEFKFEVTKWIRMNINIKPTSIQPSIMQFANNQRTIPEVERQPIDVQRRITYFSKAQ